METQIQLAALDEFNDDSTKLTGEHIDYDHASVLAQMVNK